MRKRDPRRLVAKRREAKARVSVVKQPETNSNPDGSVTSRNTADVAVPTTELERMWNTEYLERLARTYWRFLTRVSLGLIQVEYGPDSREIVLVTKPFVLLRFFAPEYDTDSKSGTVTWRINKGFLVAPQGRGKGFLRISVELHDDPATEEQTELRVVSEVANFYPLLAGWGWWKRIGRVVYRLTQYTIHNIVTNAFFRSLATLDLAESRVGRFRSRLPGVSGGRAEDDGSAEQIDPPPRDAEVAQQQTL
jgi:hypothetical protein